MEEVDFPITFDPAPPRHLVDHILMNPADDSPRLILADWLDENGQSDKAHFIRNGYRMPTVVKGRLIDEISKECHAHVEIQYDRGFVGSIVCQMVDWLTLSAHMLDEPLREVTILHGPDVRKPEDLGYLLPLTSFRFPMTRFYIQWNLAELTLRPVNVSVLPYGLIGRGRTMVVVFSNLAEGKKYSNPEWAYSFRKSDLRNHFPDYFYCLHHT